MRVPLHSHSHCPTGLLQQLLASPVCSVFCFQNNLPKIYIYQISDLFWNPSLSSHAPQNKFQTGLFMIWTVNSFLSIVGAYSPFWGSPHCLSKHWIPLEADPETAWSAGVWSGQGLGITKSRREKSRKGLRENSGCDKSQLAWKLPDDCKSGLSLLPWRACLSAHLWLQGSLRQGLLSKGQEGSDEEGTPKCLEAGMAFQGCLKLEVRELDF